MLVINPIVGGAGKTDLVNAVGSPAAQSSTMVELAQIIVAGKSNIAAAITAKGTSTAATATFAALAENVGKIRGLKQVTGRFADTGYNDSVTVDTGIHIVYVIVYTAYHNGRPNTFIMQDTITGATTSKEQYGINHISLTVSGSSFSHTQSAGSEYYYLAVGY